MQAELISVGTELLLGHTLNTNAKFLAEQLAALGINVYFQTTVGDNRERLLQVLDIASKRADLIILTGGLGPTTDDLTKEVLAEFLQLPLEIIPAEMKKLENLFKQTENQLTENNRKQAAFVPGAVVLNNEIGSAPGMAYKKGKQGYLIFPGPPPEMICMFLNYGQPWLTKVFADELQGGLYSTTLKFMGITESGLEKLLEDLLQKQGEITLAPYAKMGEIQLRITTRALNKIESTQKIAPIFNEIKKRTIPYLIAIDEQTPNKVIGQLLISQKRTISTAESCTGGALAENITAIPGSSAYYLGSIVSYANSVKAGLLGVPKELLETYGAVSREVGEFMAQQIRILTASDLGISITGIAGPGKGNSPKEVGLVYISLATAQSTICEKHHFMGEREIIRGKAVNHALYLLWQYLQNK